MTRQIFIGLTTEGSTDVRFLESIVERTFIHIAFECKNDIEPYVKVLKIDKTRLSFNEYIEKASKQGIEEMGMHILCVHTDADNRTVDKVYMEKITPAKNYLENSEACLCKILIPVVPVQMMEAWMLADKLLLKKEIGTDMSDEELGINKMPELFSDPKDVISNAIRIAHQSLAKRRRKDLSINELYASIGKKIELQKLESLPSYNTFKEEVRSAYRILNLLI